MIGKRIIKNREEALLEASMRERFLSSKGEAISAALVEVLVEPEERGFREDMYL